ncbi:MAG: acyltransferase [Myxococcales bacterium]|nr:acyltransferase [Myxococcales bacterium]
MNALVPPPPPSQVHAPLAALRATVTLLVLAHHALLAYHPYAPPVGPSLLALPFWRAFPVVDAERWSGATLIVGVNDSFFMSLMFLLAGLFAWPSLLRKGPWRHTRERWLRIGLPLAISLLVLAPLSYVPSYLQTGATWSLSGFWAQWSALDAWPSGPAWFLAVLLVFDLGALAVFVVAGSLARRRAQTPRPQLARLLASPARIALILIAASAAAYVPLAMHYGAGHWTAWGPLTFQTSRAAHYAVYFFLGLALGATGAQQSTLAAGGPLAQRWRSLLALAMIALVASFAATIRALSVGGVDARWNLLASLAFVVVCAALCLAMTALFLRFVAGRGRTWTSLARSAYGMYLLHYPIVSWLQYGLLGAALAGWTKAALVFGGAVALSWLLTLLPRRAARW